MILNRRGFLAGLGVAVAAPAIVPFHNLMKLPHMPFVRTPSGLWVRLLDGDKSEYFPALSTIGTDGETNISFTVDHLVQFERYTIGQDGNDLLHGDATNFSGLFRNSITMMNGDSARIGVKTT